MEKKMSEKKFIGAILHRKWFKTSASTITGYWAEDGNQYNIEVPPQLLDMIVDMQNTLAEQYILFHKTKDDLNRAMQKFPFKMS